MIHYLDSLFKRLSENHDKQNIAGPYQLGTQHHQYFFIKNYIIQRNLKTKQQCRNIYSLQSATP